MERFNKVLFLLLIIILPLTLINCTKYKEEAPFFDGLVLEYDAMGIPITYELSILENSKFKITKTEKYKVLRDKVEEYYVNTYGKILKSTSKESKGKFSPIWIPVHEMKIGDTFKYLEGDRFTVLRKEKWEKWDVLVIKNLDFGEERYFDLNTGYWVGLYGKSGRGAVTIVLVNTNADIPVEE